MSSFSLSFSLFLDFSLRAFCSDDIVLTADGQYIRSEGPVDLPSLPHPLTFFVNDEEPEK